MSNWGLIGHEWAVETLTRDLAQGHVRHAYLLLGPDGVGKRTLALAFAQALLCGKSPPCPDDRCCTLVTRQVHPDLSVVAPEISGKVIRTAKISVDTIRQLIYDLSLKPVESRRRVAIITDFDVAHPGAANALLKTLEEPPEDTVLILTAENEDQLLPTITSRCERLTLRPLPVGLVSDALVHDWGLTADAAHLLAHLSGGRLGWAVTMSRDEDAQPRRNAYLADMQQMLPASRVARFDYAETLSSNRDRLLEALDVWQSWWRDVLLQASGSQTALVNVDHQASIGQVAAQVSPAMAAAALRSIRATRDRLNQNANPRLTLEVLMLDLPRISH